MPTIHKEKGWLDMDKLDRDLLDRIGRALNIKLREWQINYILDIPMVLDMRITGRGTGKTLAYVIKLLFSNDYPIKAYDRNVIGLLSDDYHNISEMGYRDTHYDRWFRDYLLTIYETLKSAGINPRPVLRKPEYRLDTGTDKNDMKIEGGPWL